MQNEKLIEFIRGAEVLVMDSQYNVTEYRAHAGWGHSCVEDVVTVAARAGVKQLFLFHHDPDHSDAEVTGLVEHARAAARRLHSPVIIEGAREGMEVQLEALTATTESLE
jgi:ribonuclease BN (tRNA processing enzyme)